VATSSGNQRVATNFNRGENYNRVSTFKFLVLFVFKALSMKRACFWRFLMNNCVQIKLTNRKSALIELTSFKSFVGEVPSFCFGSMPMPPFAYKPLLQKRE